MNKIDKELERILQKRIQALVERAKYHPATVLDVPGAAYEVLRPYLETPREELMKLPGGDNLDAYCGSA